MFKRTVGGLANSRMWETLGSLGLLHQEEKKPVEAPDEAITADNVGQVLPPPQSATPPPEPPSTYSNDKPRLGSISETSEKGAIQGNGKEQGKAKGEIGAVFGKKGSKCSTWGTGQTSE